MDPLLVENRFDPKTLLVTAACLAGAAWGAYSLYLDFNMSGRRGIGSPMAKVEARESRVRRKASNSFRWANVQQNEPLYKKDSIQTGPGSEAVITFTDGSGSTLHVGENSLVVIDRVSDLSLNFLSGSFILKGAAGDKRVTVTTEGKTKVEELNVQLLKPEPLAVYFSPEKTSRHVDFGWKASKAQNSGTTLVLQVSPSKSFRGDRMITISPKPNQPLAAVGDFTPGQYYWRVFDKATSTPVTETGKFRVVQASTLTPIFPDITQKILHWGDDNTIQFQWKSPQTEIQEEALRSKISHTIEIARDPEFKSIVLHEAIPLQGPATLAKVPGGNLYWRIKSQYGKDVVLTSSSERFSVEKAQKPVLSLLQPATTMDLPARMEVPFAWSTNAKGIDYAWELQTADGKPIASNRGPESSFVWKKALPGDYKWRVTAFDQGRSLAESPWRPLAVSTAPILLRSPAANEEIRFWEKPPVFNVAWEKDPLTAQGDYQYSFEVAEDEDFKKITAARRTRETTIVSESLKLPPGKKYFWRVSLQDSSGHTLKSSERWAFVYDVFPPLKPPSLVKPAAGTEYNILDKEENPVLTWTDVKDATAYEVTIFTEPPHQRKPAQATQQAPQQVRQFVTDKLTTEVKGLKVGDYTWTVRAIDKIKRTGEASPNRKFVITYGDTLDAPEAVSPEAQ